MRTLIDRQKIGSLRHKCLLICIGLCLFLLLLSVTNLSLAAHPLQINKAPTSIARFIYHVWHTNAAIQSAQSEVARAHADLLQSQRPIYNPNLGIEVERVHRVQLDDKYVADVSQTIDLFNKRGARAVVGQKDLLASNANLARQRLSLASQTLKALAKYRMAQVIVRLAKQRTALLRRFQKQTMRRFKSGDIAQDAVDLASLAYAEAISQQANEEVALTRAKQELTAISQTDVKYWPRLPHYLPTPLKPSAFIKHRWLRRLPILRLYQARVAAAQASIRVAETNAKPDPTVSIRGGSEDNELLIGGSFSIPLFVRNNFHDRIRAFNHQAIAVEQDRMNTYRHAKAMLNGDLTRYKILYDATKNWQHASKHSLAGGIDLLNRLWSAGELSTTNYLVQLKQRIDSQIAGVKLKANAWQTWFSVMKASGQMKVWLAKC